MRTQRQYANRSQLPAYYMYRWGNKYFLCMYNKCFVLQLRLLYGFVHCIIFYHLLVNEKALRDTQTLRAGCSKAEPKKFAPPQTPFPGAQDGQNLIGWRTVQDLYLQTQFGVD